MTVVALDIGFGNAKGVAEGKTVVFPSVVAVPAGDLGLAGIGMRTARPATRVTFDRGDFYVGPAARSWGRVVENLDFSRLASPEAEALFYALMAELVPEGTAVRLVLGLPVPLLRDEAVARPVLESLRARLVREHRVQVNGRAFSFAVSAVRAAAQPVGAWADWALDGEGRWAHRAAQSALVAVLDVGFNTLDLYGIRGGRLEPRLVGGDKVGVRRLLDLAAPGEPYHEADERVRAGKGNDSALATWLSEILGTAERVWNGVRLDLLLLVGGGAVLLRDRQDAFRRAFRAEVVVPEEPVVANARGLWKWGQTVRW
ncbi:MAG: hypothetical protein N2556_04195 [Anaerolineae bacterium]|nr:hypothetical protein [Anaerolineae bacterium]